MSVGLRRRQKGERRPCRPRLIRWWTWGSLKWSGQPWRRQWRWKLSSASCPSTLWSSQRKTLPCGNAGVSWVWMYATWRRCSRKCLVRPASRRRWSFPFIKIELLCSELINQLVILKPTLLISHVEQSRHLWLFSVSAVFVFLPPLILFAPSDHGAAKRKLSAGAGWTEWL